MESRLLSQDVGGQTEKKVGDLSFFWQTNEIRTFLPYQPTGVASVGCVFFPFFTEQGQFSLFVCTQILLLSQDL